MRVVPWADPRDLQDRLFAALSAMFATEVPLYGGALAVNDLCNAAAVALLEQRFPVLGTVACRHRTLGAERHGAIRIGRPDEYRWVGRLFACFGMEPHGFYDMTSVGAKRQPIIATAFRSRIRPEHRMFCSLLVTDAFPAATRRRVEEALATRDVFGDDARGLVEKHERQGGLGDGDGDRLIAECVGRIFAWSGRGGPLELYRDLVDADMRIAADIACFPSHHLNHLAFNAVAIDLFTSAMRRCLGERDRTWFRDRATAVLGDLARRADADLVRLLVPHAPEDLGAAADPSAAAIGAIVDGLDRQLDDDRCALHRLPHAGFKESTEGPPADVPILLRQDSYRALTETVTFTTAAGHPCPGTHTARFGEVEQRGYACSADGRRIYDACLAAASFTPLGHDAATLFARGQILGRYRPTVTGLAARVAGVELPTTLPDLLTAGYVAREPLRYEDFLPVSAAGIFASNLRQSGAGIGTVAAPPRTAAELEAILGRSIVDPVRADAATEAESIRETLVALGVVAPAGAPAGPRGGGGDDGRA
ncbi:MAG: 2-oxoadipate dioxygenase/decarboxylase family protein [Planctomycetaceae bacterium]